MKILEKQIKSIEDHGKQLVESNELIKKDFNIDRDGVSLDEQKIIFNELVDDKSHEFQNLKMKLTLLIWHISTELKEEVQNILEIIKI